MSLRLLVDGDTQAHRLIRALRSAGHDVISANEAGLRRERDEVIFRYALADSRSILTRNAGDFRAIWLQSDVKVGILAVHLDNDPTKDMSPADIVRSIANLEASGWDFEEEFVSLHAWRF